MRIPLMTTLVVSALAIGAAAHAQSSSTDTAKPSGQQMQMQMHSGQSSTSLEQLMDRQVVGTGGEQIGEVTDVLVDANGKPQKVVIEHGGFLGMGQREVALDINDINMQGDNVQISATKEQLSAMPEWDNSQLSSTGYLSGRGEGGSQTGATGGTTKQPGTD